MNLVKGLMYEKNVVNEWKLEGIRRSGSNWKWIKEMGERCILCVIGV